MKLHIFILCLLISAYTHIQSQTSYSYDKSGNCNGRKTISLRSSIKPGSDKIVEIFTDDIFSNIKIYPNPTKGLLKIGIEDYNFTSSIDIAIYDLKGTLLIKDKISSSTIDLDLRSYSNGIYILVLKKEEQISEWKILKTN
ncbi:T9SS type A sorting domain-containing protein [Dysgonomonas macrotermitis]|uniref:Por secretion system C-terminal sorting domain-containing protein n=1 Tax=Dysgonomonas macrotermitis TaxID=1346286 RepID=A0A1M4YF29_9BACT|nr:Por secretion system C-terminal sorting domain-containing protein [Dysgonomonas macrotermitis]